MDSIPYDYCDVCGSPIENGELYFQYGDFILCSSNCLEEIEEKEDENVN